MLTQTTSRRVAPKAPEWLVADAEQTAVKLLAIVKGDTLFDKANVALAVIENTLNSYFKSQAQAKNRLFAARRYLCELRNMELDRIQKERFARERIREKRLALAHKLIASIMQDTDPEFAEQNKLLQSVSKVLKDGTPNIPDLIKASLATGEYGLQDILEVAVQVADDMQLQSLQQGRYHEMNRWGVKGNAINQLVKKLDDLPECRNLEPTKFKCRRMTL